MQCRHEPLYRIEHGYPILPAATTEDEETGAIENEMYGYGTIVSFQCNDGYRLVNGSTRMCQLNGTWSESQPHCASKYIVVQLSIIVILYVCVYLCMAT